MHTHVCDGVQKDIICSLMIKVKLGTMKMHCSLSKIAMKGLLQIAIYSFLIVLNLKFIIQFTLYPLPSTLYGSVEFSLQALPATLCTLCSTIYPPPPPLSKQLTCYSLHYITLYNVLSKLYQATCTHYEPPFKLHQLLSALYTLQPIWEVPSAVDYQLRMACDKWLELGIQVSLDINLTLYLLLLQPAANY